MVVSLTVGRTRLIIVMVIVAMVAVVVAIGVVSTVGFVNELTHLVIPAFKTVICTTTFRPKD